MIDDIKKGEEEIGDESGRSKEESRSAGCQDDSGGKSQSVKVRCTCNKKIWEFRRITGGMEGLHGVARAGQANGFSTGDRNGGSF